MPDNPTILTPVQFAMAASEGEWKPAKHLMMMQRWFLEALYGKRQGFMVSLPPGSGKSSFLCKYLPVWYLGMYPDRLVAVVSNEATLAQNWGRQARNLMEKVGPRYFGVSVDPRSKAADEWHIERHDGGMISLGAGGPIMGRRPHLIVVDDPIKNAEEALSETMREKLWDWWFSSVLYRLEPGGFPILVMHRWHEDDLIGKILTAQSAPEDLTQEAKPKLKMDYLRIPALAEEGDPLGRKPGEALWPWRFPRERLLALQSFNEHTFESLYQQNPVPKEGALFKWAWLSRFEDAAPREAVRVRYWDRAATAKAGDYTCGILMSRTSDGIFHVENVVRGQWDVGQRDNIILRTAKEDERRFDGKVNIFVEQEPAGSGKEAVASAARLLEGYRIYADRPTGDKEVRAGTFASVAAQGRVILTKAAWNLSYISELCAFPNGRNDDQVDASSGAFNRLARKNEVNWDPSMLSLDGYKGREIKVGMEDAP